MSDKNNSIANGNEVIQYDQLHLFNHDENIGNVQPLKLIFLLPSLNNLIEVFQREAGLKSLFSAPNLDLQGPLYYKNSCRFN